MKLALILMFFVVWSIFVLIYIKKKRQNNKISKNKQIYQEDLITSNIETQATPSTQNSNLDNVVSNQLRISFVKATSSGIGFNEWIKTEKTMLENLNFLREIEITQKNGLKKKKLIYEDILEDVFRINTRLFYANNRYDVCLNSISTHIAYFSIYCEIPAHKELNNLVLPKKHPFWDTHFPPNALKCQCNTRCYTQSMLQKRDLQITTNIPNIQLESLYNKNYAKYSKLTNKLITPYLSKLDVRKKAKEIYTNIEYINIALGYITKANNLKTITSKEQYLDTALTKLSEGLKDNNTDVEMLDIQIDKIYTYKKELNII